MDEKRAINLCLNHRDPVGFEYLVKQYRREAFQHAYALMGNPEDAADACQESFAKAFAAIPRLEQLTHFYPWFYRILRNCCLNMLSRRRTAKQYSQAQAEAAPPAFRSDQLDPSGILQQSEEQQSVWHTLETLKPEFREILTLKYIQGKTYDQISRLLRIPRGTVMSRLYHARTSFRDNHSPSSSQRAAKELS